MDILVHGGAGGTPNEPDKRQRVLDEAANAGATAADSVSAVVTALTILESSPRFNAGTGGAVQSDGLVRTDAGIMTADRSAGAVCGMIGVENAIRVAAHVMEDTPHVLLAGPQACELAALHGISTDCDLQTGETRDRFHESGLASANFSVQLETVNARFGTGHDTVGAVATDGTTVVAGTSTGGRWLALAGRVGDVPQIGSGFYASEVGAVSTTGAGEDIARMTLARLAERSLREHGDPSRAASEALNRFCAVCDGTAGLIVMTPEGTYGSDFSSELMQTAVARA